MQSRRLAMLQGFMKAARFIASPFVSFRRRSKGKGKGKATSGGRAGEFRKRQFRDDKKAAAVARLQLEKKPAALSIARSTPPRPPPIGPRYQPR
jgi:hypothetical protein